MQRYKTRLNAALTLALLVPGVTLADVQTSGILKSEVGVLMDNGLRTGEATSTLDTKGAGRKLYKFQNSARVFFDGDISDATTWHAEVKLIANTAATSQRYRAYLHYSQYDYLREIYTDSTIGNWDIRLGKQQVVWGTADGIKLLDIINPTDYRFLNQASMEDSRIPVWMANAEYDLADGDSVQLIAGQARPNEIPGFMHSNRTASVIYNNPMGGTPSNNSALQGVDSGEPFIMKGVDTLFGRVNGFFNIAPAMGAVATTFHASGATTISSANTTTVGDYTAGSYQRNSQGNCLPLAGSTNGANCLATVTQMTNHYVTNLIDTPVAADNTTGAGWNPSNPNSTWEYMPNATFATFNTYAGMSTRFDMSHLPKATDLNLGTRYRTTFNNGLNLSFNYLYAYDPNPVVNTHWEDPNTGARLSAKEFQTTGNTTVVQIQDAAGNGYGATATYNPADFVGGIAPDNVATPKPAQLVFKETLARVNNIGSSFDYSFNAGSLPLVVRGEFLYQNGVPQPIVDKRELSIGNLTAALTTKKSNFFKYVIGLDATALTNMLTSVQFIQFRNLSYVDEQRTCTYTSSTGPKTFDCSRYTADPSTMHLNNGLQKGWKNKNFVSLYLSKPFGESQQGRWNNLLIYEEGGGYWDRINGQYAISDHLVLLAALNFYWGNPNTTFGQFKHSSNAEIGVKWLLN